MVPPSSELDDTALWITRQMEVPALRRLIVTVTVLLALTCVAASGVNGQGNTQPGAEQFVLSGVLVLDGEKGIAWLLEPKLTQNVIVAVRAGESVGPYKLTRVLTDRVELEGPTGKLLVPLYTAGSGTAQTAVAASPPSPSLPVPERGAASAPVPSSQFPTTFEPPANLHQAQALQHLEGMRQAAETAQAKTAGSTPGHPGSIVYTKGDPRLTGAFHSMFGGR